MKVSPYFLPGCSLEYITLIEWKQTSCHGHIVVVEVRANLHTSLIGSSCQSNKDCGGNSNTLNVIAIIVITILVFLYFQIRDVSFHRYTTQSIRSWLLSKIGECSLANPLSIVYLYVVGVTRYIASNTIREINIVCFQYKRPCL